MTPPEWCIADLEENKRKEMERGMVQAFLEVMEVGSRRTFNFSSLNCSTDTKSALHFLNRRSSG